MGEAISTSTGKGANEMTLEELKEFETTLREKYEESKTNENVRFSSVEGMCWSSVKKKIAAVEAIELENQKEGN